MMWVVKKKELYHHGIAGQKWGQRQGPPYPLAASKHSAAEKKAGQRQSSNVRVSYNRNVVKNVDPFYIPSAERKKMRKEMDRLNKKISADPNKASKKDAERFLVLYTAMQNHEKVKKQVESHSRKKR